MSAARDDSLPTVSYRSTAAGVVAYLEARLAAAEALLDLSEGGDPQLAERMRNYWKALRQAGPVEDWAAEAWRRYGMMP